MAITREISKEITPELEASLVNDLTKVLTEKGIKFVISKTEYRVDYLIAIVDVFSNLEDGYSLRVDIEHETSGSYIRSVIKPASRPYHVDGYKRRKTFKDVSKVIAFLEEGFSEHYRVNNAYEEKKNNEKIAFEKLAVIMKAMGYEDTTYKYATSDRTYTHPSKPSIKAGVEHGRVAITLQFDINNLDSISDVIKL